MTFEPVSVDAKWLCPCKDAYGSAAELHVSSIPHAPTDFQGEQTVTNYACDQNGDRWQQITSADGVISWHYLGRPGVPA